MTYIPETSTNAPENPPSLICPRGSFDRTTYRSVHFYGRQLTGPLEQAAHYIKQLEEMTNGQPNILCIHEEFSWEDEGSDVAWRVSLVFGEPAGDLW